MNMIKSFKYRLYPTRKQELALNNTLTTCRILYNNSLDQRITEYKEHDKTLSYADQCKNLTSTKNTYQQLVHSQVLQETLKRLDKTYKSFFRRVKENKVKSGFPRFKSWTRYHSFCYSQSGFRLTNNNKRISLSKIGDIKLRYSRPIEGTIKTCRVIRDVDQWFVVLTCISDSKPVHQSTNPPIGVDVGLTTFLALSDGTHIENPRCLKNSEVKLSKTQRKLSHLTKGSSNRNKQRIKVAKVHRTIRRQRDDFLHKLSTELVSKYGRIIFEDLNINGMLKNHKLAKHIADASWNKLIQFTTYKAESAGCVVELVNARNTSQLCSGCGSKVSKTLADRIHCCPQCGLELDRDDNAARNILARSIGRAGQARTQASGELIRPLNRKARFIEGRIPRF